jgi:hypothetical protein
MNSGVEAEHLWLLRGVPRGGILPYDVLVQAQYSRMDHLQRSRFEPSEFELTGTGAEDGASEAIEI